MQVMRGIRQAVSATSIVSLLVLVGCSTPPTLRSVDVQDQIEAGLADQVGGDFTVVCPSGVPAEAGTTFTCSVTDEADGTTVDVIVTESDDSGGFEWRVRVPRASATASASPS